MLWRVNLRKKLAEDGGEGGSGEKMGEEKGKLIGEGTGEKDAHAGQGKGESKRKGKPDSSSEFVGHVEAEGADESNVNLGKSKKNRVMKRRIQSVAGQRRDVPKVVVNVSLQQSAIEVSYVLQISVPETLLFFDD